jgi:hypothetical protein
MVWSHTLFAMAQDINVASAFGLSNSDLIHEIPVLLFKIKQGNYYEAASKFIPNVVITLTQDFIFHFWVENLANVNKLFKY